YDAAIGARIGSNQGGRITIDGNGNSEIYWLISNRHTSGEVIFENLLITGGHSGAMSMIFPELQGNATLTLNNVIIDGEDIVEFPVRPDLLGGGTINFNEVVLTGAARMAILHSTSGGTGTFNIYNSTIIGKQLAIAIEPAGGPVDWTIHNSYLGTTDTGSYSAMWVRAPNQNLQIEKTVFNMSGGGSAFFLFPGSGCHLVMDHCDILSEYIGVRLTTGNNRSISISNTNIVSDSVGFFGTTDPSDTVQFSNNNVPGGYDTFAPGLNDIIPGIVPDYMDTLYPDTDFTYTNGTLLTGDEFGGPIGSEYNTLVGPLPTFTPTATFTATPTWTPTPTPDPLSTPTPTPTPNMDEQSYIDQFIAYWTGIGQIPATVPTLEEYATIEKFDQLFMTSLNDYWVNLIPVQQNLQAGMGWGSSYQTHALNDMYRATGDIEYLRQNQRILEQTMANRDDKVGHMTFFGVMAPAWGTPYYAGRHVIHLVHTGMIATGVVEFLEIVQDNPTAMAELSQTTFDTWVTEIHETIDWHDREWIDGPAFDEGYYIAVDEEIEAEGSPQSVNRQSAMGMALWGSWKATGNTAHRDKALKLGRYIKRRMGLYQGPKYGSGTYFWEYTLPFSDRNNPRPESEVPNLNGGEDFSHATLSIIFPLTLGLDGEVFTEEDMKAFANSVLLGCGRLGNGIFYGNIVGTPRFGPDQVQVVGNLFRVVEDSPEAFDAVAEFMLRYQKTPRNVDLSQLIRFKPKLEQPKSSSWMFY
ncbi:MAG: hypothetical protein KC931_13995, partial [Candidatus Omnitrophica bacterium]|nr:hypothetical protein [Candidatus Omnitrophota bacterium]